MNSYEILKANDQSHHSLCLQGEEVRGVYFHLDVQRDLHETILFNPASGNWRQPHYFSATELYHFGRQLRHVKSMRVMQGTCFSI